MDWAGRGGAGEAGHQAAVLAWLEAGIGIEVQVRVCLFLLMTMIPTLGGTQGPG